MKNSLNEIKINLSSNAYIPNEQLKDFIYNNYITCSNKRYNINGNSQIEKYPSSFINTSSNQIGQKNYRDLLNMSLKNKKIIVNKMGFIKRKEDINKIKNEKTYNSIISEKFIDFNKTEKIKKKSQIKSIEKDRNIIYINFPTQNISHRNKFNLTLDIDKNNINKDNNNNSEYNTKNNNENENNTTSSNLTNFIDKNDHDSEYGIIIPEIIKCKKIENTEFSNHKDIVIKITDPIKVETSFFLGKSVNYLVTTSPFKYTVRRRYSDFLWLRETLINLFNTNLIPKITKKGKVTDDKHDDNLIKKRMKVLENFINFLTKDEIIKSSQIFYDFLTIQRDEDFQSKKKFYDKIKFNPMDDIRERKSLDGELKIKINKEKEIYLENIKDNSIYNSNIFKKLNNNFKLLQEEFTTVIKRFESISDVYRELYTISKNYLDQNTITETYAQMEIMFKKLSESFNTMKAFINGDIREYFKFVMNNYGNISEMVENIELTKNNYMKLSKNLISKKNDLFKKGDISKWEISSNDYINSRELIKDKVLACNKMLPKETKTCINSKEIYGFYLNRLISEFERMRQINAYFHKKKACHFCQEQIIICSNYTRILGDIIMVIDSCINKKH